MFKNLMDFGYQRTAKEAFGFYLAYLLLIAVVCGVLSGLIGFVVADSGTFAEGFKKGVRIGAPIAVCIVLTISFTILAKKKRLSHFGYLLLALLSGALSLLGGGLLGLIPVAVLTTRKQAS